MVPRPVGLFRQVSTTPVRYLLPRASDGGGLSAAKTLHMLRSPMHVMIEDAAASAWEPQAVECAALTDSGCVRLCAVRSHIIRPCG